MADKRFYRISGGGPVQKSTLPNQSFYNMLLESNKTHKRIPNEMMPFVLEANKKETRGTLVNLQILAAGEDEFVVLIRSLFNKLSEKNRKDVFGKLIDFGFDEVCAEKLMDYTLKQLVEFRNLSDVAILLAMLCQVGKMNEQMIFIKVNEEVKNFCLLDSVKEEDMNKCEGLFILIGCLKNTKSIKSFSGERIRGLILMLVNKIHTEGKVFIIMHLKALIESIEVIDFDKDQILEGLGAIIKTKGAVPTRERCLIMDMIDKLNDDD